MNPSANNNSSKPATAASSFASASSSASAAASANVQEFVIRVPKNMKKRHHVMRFNATLNVDFAQWKSVKMERENNLKDFRQMDEEVPKFGAGSEYNRDFKEEVRRKKFGIISKRYKPEAQPWILKVGSKGPQGKKFRGIREGGVGENAAFYVFTHAPDKAIEAYPLNEWYNFQPIQRYKSLSAEEAEHEFGRRKKVLNYFSLMLRKRLKGDEADDGGDDGEEKKGGNSSGGGGPKGKAKELKISDMDEWIDSDDDDDSEESGAEKEKKEADSDEEKAKNKNKKNIKKEALKTAGKKKKKRDPDDEAFEESDDGDEEGREMDYNSDSSDEVSDQELQIDKDMKGVAEEDALRKLLTSDEDSDEEQKKSDGDENKDEEDSPVKKESKTSNSKDNKEKDSQSAKEKLKKKKIKAKKLLKKKDNDNKKESSSSTSSDSSDSDVEDKKKAKKKDTSRSTSPNPESSSKRKLGGHLPSDLTTPDSSNSPINTPAKKPKLEAAPSMPSTFSSSSNLNSKDDYGITEEAVRRYLMRKPMTTTELLTKFKNKKTGVSSDKLVETMTQILKKINPVKQTIQGKMYLSIQR